MEIQLSKLEDIVAICGYCIYEAVENVRRS